MPGIKWIAYREGKDPRALVLLRERKGMALKLTDLRMWHGPLERALDVAEGLGLPLFVVFAFPLETLWVRVRRGEYHTRDRMKERTKLGDFYETEAVFPHRMARPLVSREWGGGLDR